MRIRVRDATTLALAALWTLGAPSMGRGQEPQPAPPTVLTIRPAKAPIPALKYRLTPDQRKLVPGNAAIFYHRACLMIATSARDNALENKIVGWLTGPADRIDRAEARKSLEGFKNVLHEAELGAFCKECDWQFDDRKEGFNLLLPEIQEIRRVGRLVTLKARLELIEGHHAEAMHWLEVGHAMSRHIGDTPFLIAGLVGVAISMQLKQPLEDLIQTSGGPNLYWALATRPRPLIDMRHAIEGERLSLERELPELREIDGPAWTAERARAFGDELFTKLRSFTGELRMITPAGAKAGVGSARLEDLPSRLALAAVVARVYPEAKRALIAAGRSSADVEAMPTLQVVTLHTLQSYNALRDDVFKWSAFPYWQTRDRMNAAAWKGHRTVSNKLANPLLTMFTALMPAIGSALLANDRIDRQLDALQCVEAIRIYAAEHDGNLPDSLDAMTDTPLPIDPVTGKPFEYTKVDATTVTLTAPYPPGGPKVPQYMIRYELKLAK